MTIALIILGGWLALSITAAPVLLPLLARRYARNREWIKAPPGRHHLSSVIPQVRMLRR